MHLAVVFVALAISLCGASVDFTYSTLYDIDDFVGKDEVPISKCDNGCLIFASTMGDAFVASTSGYDPYAEKLLIHNNKDAANHSITDLSRLYDEKSSQKLPLDITGPASISVLNVNINDAPSAIALYVVEKSKAAECSYQVYDVLNMRGITTDPNSITTVMSVFGFNIVAKRDGRENGVTARLVGFDNALDSNSDNCPVAYSTATESSFRGFNLNIDGPLISLLFNERNPVQIDASVGFVPVYDLSVDGFITPGGYNGCEKPHTGGVQSFRSSLMKTSSTYIFDSNKQKYRVSFDVVPNMDDDHNVIITDLGNLPVNRKEIVTGYKPVSLTFDHTDNIQVEFKNLYGDQGFLMRYKGEVLPDNGSTKPASSSTSTIAQSSTSPTPTTTSSTTTMTPTTSGSQGIENVLLPAVLTFAIARIV